MWWVKAMQIADGEHKLRWRMTATSDEDGGGPFGDNSHSHATAEEAEACDACDDYTSGITGFPSRKKTLEAKEARDRSEFERLKAKFEP